MEIEAHESKALRSHFKLYQPVENSVNESKCETSVASYASNVAATVSGCVKKADNAMGRGANNG